jgi:hypothetical protein
MKTFGSRTHNPLTFPTKFGTYAHPMPSIVSTKNSSGAFFFPLESERKAPLRRLRAQGLRRPLKAPFGFSEAQSLDSFHQILGFE